MQQPSPALSSPSTGFFGPRASPLFTQTVDQPDPPPADSSRAAHLITSSISSSADNGGQQAPPKQLAQGMEALSHALRIIAEIRVGGDMLIQALVQSSAFKSTHLSSSSNSTQPSDFVSRASDAMAALFEELRVTGRKLEALGVMHGAQQRFEEKHPWGLQLPLICPDGAIVAYSWKRQIAGQAAASAVERTRLALKAFTEQKRRFFRRMGDPNEEIEDALWPEKRVKSMVAEVMVPGQMKVDNCSMLLDVLKSWQSETPILTIASYTRLEWAQHKSTLAAQKRNSGVGLSDKLSAPAKPGLDASYVERVSVLEVVVPTILKAVISLFPSGSTTPDAVSVFSADEICSNVHLGGTSAYAVFRRVSVRNAQSFTMKAT